MHMTNFSVWLADNFIMFAADFKLIYRRSDLAKLYSWSKVNWIFVILRSKPSAYSLDAVTCQIGQPSVLWPFAVSAKHIAKVTTKVKLIQLHFIGLMTIQNSSGGIKMMTLEANCAKERWEYLIAWGLPFDYAHNMPELSHHEDVGRTMRIYQAF